MSKKKKITDKITVWLVNIDDEPAFYTNNLLDELKTWMPGWINESGCIVKIETSTMTQKQYDKLPESM